MYTGLSLSLSSTKISTRYNLNSFLFCLSNYFSFPLLLSISLQEWPKLMSEVISAAYCKTRLYYFIVHHFAYFLVRSFNIILPHSLYGTKVETNSSFLKPASWRKSRVPTRGTNYIENYGFWRHIPVSRVWIDLNESVKWLKLSTERIKRQGEVNWWENLRKWGFMQSLDHDCPRKIDKTGLPLKADLLLAWYSSRK